MLATAIGNLITVLNPSRVILGEVCSSLVPSCGGDVAREAMAIAGASARSSVQVVDAALGDDAGVVGSALRALASASPSAARGTA